MTNIKASIAALSLLSACGKGEDPSSGCRSSADCGQGLVCIVSAGTGSCQSPPVVVAMTTPAAGARVGRAGVPVQAWVTLAAADGAAPPSVVMVAGSSEAGALQLTARDGAVLTYAGVYAPPAGVVMNALSLFVAAKTSAGSVPSDGVLIDVDTKPPVLTSSGGACGLGPCWRDGRLDVFVEVGDDHPGDDVVVLLDLDGYQQTFPFGPSQVPPQLLAQVPLRSYPFPRFSGTVKPRIRARDTFGNESVLDLAPLEMTRLRWAYTAGTPVTGAAIDNDGHVLVGLSSTTNNLLTIDGSGSKVHSVTVAKPPATTGSFITSAPSIGAKTWVGSSDGVLYGVDPTFLSVGPACPTTAASGTMFTPAVRFGPTEAAYSGGSAGKLYGAAVATCFPADANIGEALVSSPVIASGAAYVGTKNGVGAVTLRAFGGDLATGVVTPVKDASVTCTSADASLAWDGSGVIIPCGNGHIFVVAGQSTQPTLIASFSAAAPTDIALFPNGDLLIGTNDGKLHRLEQASAWNDAWSATASLGAAVRGVAVSAPDVDGVVAYATTAQGQLYAVDQDGKVIWSTSGEPAPEPLGVSALSFPTIAPADGGRAGSLPTLYAGSDDGHVYAVAVDTGLDPASPWPKAHRDLRNTNDADAPKDW